LSIAATSLQEAQKPAMAFNFDGVALAPDDLKPGQSDQRRSTVAVDVIDGVLLIGINRDDQNLIDPATFVALGEPFTGLTMTTACGSQFSTDVVRISSQESTRQRGRRR
jgi:hypothetical protein